MKTRIFQTRFWEDSFITELPSRAKLVFVFLLTNNLIGLTGAYECPARNIAFNTGLSVEQVKEALELLKEKIHFSIGWVVIKNAQKYNNYTSNIKLQKAYLKEREQLPENIREMVPNIAINDTSMIVVPYHPHTSHKPKTKNKKLKTINQKPEKETASIAYLQKPEFITLLRARFPKINVTQELEKCVNWLKANGKVKKDYQAFATNWLIQAVEFKQKNATSITYIRCQQCGKSLQESAFYKHACVSSTSEFAKTLMAKMPKL